MRRARAAVAWFHRHPTVFVVLLIVMAVWDLDWNGRRHVVITQRAQCHRSALNLVQAINELRDSQNTNLQIANDPQSPVITAAARRGQAGREAGRVLVYDSHLDRGDWPLLTSTIDRSAVRNGQWVHDPHTHRLIFLAPFTCTGAYPAAPAIQINAS